MAVHSFGLEVLTLRRAERGVSRALAAAGHPVLFVHRRGFGGGERAGDPALGAPEREDLESERVTATNPRSVAAGDPAPS